MSDDVRRSGRATKGQHTKTQEDGPGSGKKGKAGKGGRKSKQAQDAGEDEEEDDAYIRCVCGQYNEDEEGRNMICCDKCQAWQHNDCMGLGDDYSPPKYFCEQCKPGEHKELLAAIKRGEKPWEDASKQRDQEEHQKTKKKSSKKGGRKSAARQTEELRTPTVEPEEPVTAAKKRKYEDEPSLPTNGGRSKKVRSAQLEDEDDPVAEVTVEAAEADEQEAQPELETEEVDDEEDDLLVGVAQDAKGITDPTRSKIATGVIKSFVDQVASLHSRKSLSLPKGESAGSLGTTIALQVEHAVYQVRSGGEGEPNDAYKDHIRAILNNTKTNTDLALRLMKRELSAVELARMEPKDMATDEQKQRDADEKMRMEKQHVLTEEEKGPRIRKTHKGDEYIEEPTTVPESTAKVVSTIDSNNTDVEMKSPPVKPTTEKPQPLRKPSASSRGKPFGDTRRKTSANFDIDRVWSGVQGSPTEAEAPKFPTPARGRPSGQSQTPIGADADVDRLLKDEENDSEPYSPKDFVEEGIVWRGKINGGNLGTFNTAAKFAAGCQPDVDNLKMRWDEVIPPEIKLHGRIHPAKADEYLCGLEYSSSSELLIVNVLEPKSATEQKEFARFFSYLKDRERYGVGLQHTNPAVKDIYLIPLEPGQSLPSVMKALEHQFVEPVVERTLLMPIVVRWTELPHNAERVRQQQSLQQAGQSPSAAAPVAQTPITPRETQSSNFETASYGATNGGHPHDIPTQRAPVQQANSQSSTPVTLPPAAITAQRILGPEMAALPAIVNLIIQAPTAGENEFLVIKECILEDPEAGKSLAVLTESLQQKFTNKHSGENQAKAGGPTGSSS